MAEKVRKSDLSWKIVQIDAFCDWNVDRSTRGTFGLALGENLTCPTHLDAAHPERCGESTQNMLSVKEYPDGVLISGLMESHP